MELTNFMFNWVETRMLFLVTGKYVCVRDKKDVRVSEACHVRVSNPFSLLDKNF